MKGVTLPTETVFVLEMSPIKFGLGASDEIGYDARRLGLKRVLIVTDRHLVEVGLPDRIRALLDEEGRSEEHTSELQSRLHLVCRLLLEKKKDSRNGGACGG